MTEVPVLIAGGGPVGLVLAHELEYRGINAILVERNLETTRHPKMDVTNGRSMEHFRRLGIADAVRAHGVPTDHTMSVVWCTRLAEWELTRFDYPSIDWGRDIIRYVNDGSMPLEPDMRISQVVLEPVLKNLLERRAKHIDVRFGWGLESFVENDDGVVAKITSTETGETQEIACQYLAGCDGAGSVVRRQLNIGLDDASTASAMKKAVGFRKMLSGAVKGILRGERPPDGRMYMIHFKSKERAFFERFGQAWHIQSGVGGTIISQNDRDTWTIHVPLAGGTDAEAIDPKAFLFECIGREFECEILVANAWRPRLCVADRYGEGRVWLAGDSAHQVVPTGGYGMNTGVGDAVDLGWKLAARLEGWGGEDLLPSYEEERRPVGLRNRAASARHQGIRVEIGAAHSPSLHDDSPRGERARKILGDRIRDLGNLENEALGIEIGYRYDDSSVICHEEGDAPPQEMARYAPTTWPGARIPSVFLEDGRALFDLLSPGFTLIRFTNIDVAPLLDAAAERGVPVHVLDLREDRVRAIYERDLILIRPDQHVAWRGNRIPNHPTRIIDRVRGAAPDLIET